MPEPLFTGVGVALATLFDDDGEVDAKATAGLAATLADLGVRGVVVAGSTGEASALTAGERVALLTETRRAVPSGVPVIAGTGGASARQAAALTRDAREAGADAVLALCPPRNNDPRPYYDAVAEAAGGLPALAYHFPQTAPPGIPVEALPDLPVQGMKDSSGDPERLLSELEVFDRPLYVGAAMLVLHGRVARHRRRHPGRGQRRPRARHRRLRRRPRRPAGPAGRPPAGQGPLPLRPEGRHRRPLRHQPGDPPRLTRLAPLQPSS